MPRSRFLWIAGICTVTYALSAWVLYLALAPEPRSSLSLRNVEIHGFAPTGEFVTQDLVAHPLTSTSVRQRPETVRFWDTHSGKNVAAYQHPDGDSIDRIALAPMGNLAYWSAKDNLLRVLDRDGTERLQARSGFTHRNAPEAWLQFAPDGKSLLHLPAEATIEVLDVETGRVRASWAAQPNPYGPFVLSQNGELIALPGEDSYRKLGVQRISVRKVATGEELAMHGDFEGHLQAVSFSHDAAHLLVATQLHGGHKLDSSAIHRIYVASVAQPAATKLLTNHKFLGFVDEGRSILTETWTTTLVDPTYVAFEFPSLRERSQTKGTQNDSEWIWSSARISGSPGAYFAVDVRRKIGSSLSSWAWGSGDTIVRVFDARTGERVGAVGTKSTEGSQVHFSPDGTTMAVLNKDSEEVLIRFYDVPPPPPWLHVLLWPVVTVSFVLLLGLLATRRKARLHRAA